MINLFPEHISLSRIAHCCLSFGGVVSYNSTIWSMFYIIYHWTVYHVYCIASIIELCLETKELNVMIEILSSVTVYYMAFIKAIRLFFKRKEMSDILDRLERIHLELLNDYETNNLLIEEENSGKKLISLFLLSGTSTPFLGFVITTIFDLITNFENKKLLAVVWIPWSIEEIWPYYLAKFVTMLMIVCGVAIYTGYDVLDFSFSFQMSAFIKILQNYLTTKDLQDKKIYELHQVIIQLIDDYKDIVGGPKYFETVFSPVMPCGFGITLIRAMKRSQFNQWDTFQKMICCLMPPFVQCCCGQQIITEMEKLHEAAYMRDWYKEKPNGRRDLLMIMTRTIKPTTMNYRLFVTFDHAYLAKVLQAIYSFFMLLISFDIV